ncbi:MAG: hypothetical protein J6K64_00085 [Clostridia bacterium]|nr:hypothetical protein [Clostridia bacterium]
MKDTIIKSITAIICVVVLCVTSSVAIGDYSDAVKEAAKLAPVATVGGNNAATNNGADVPSDTPADVPSDVPADTPADTPADVPADTPTDAPADAPSNAPSGDNKPAALTKADVIKIFNTETAKAAKGSYSFTRTGKFVNPINVGSATDAINGIIHGVDKNASLDSVVGGFIGVKAQPITGTVKAGKGEGFDAKYMIKAMKLTEADVTSFSVNGNKYTITVKDCTNPNASSAMAHATDDYITYPEVNKSIANEVGSAIKVVENESTANYKKITFTATIVNGKMTALEYSYSFDATLKLKLTLIPATGTGSASITNKFTNIKY